MNKISFLLLAILAPIGAQACQADAPFTQVDSAKEVLEASAAETDISDSLSLAQANQGAIYEYADDVFEKISANIEKDFLKNLEQNYAIRITSR